MTDNRELAGDLRHAAKVIEEASQGIAPRRTVTRFIEALRRHADDLEGLDKEAQG